MFFVAFIALLFGCTNDNYSDLYPRDSTTEATIEIGWIAYKYPVFEERVGVSGTFNDYEIGFINKSEDIIEKLTYAEISIPTSSVMVGDHETRTSNVYNYFFKYFTTRIRGRINSIDETEAMVAITINGITQNIPFSVSIDKAKCNIVFNGSIENINPFGAEIAFNRLNEVCGEFHNDFVWSDIDIEILVANYDLLEF